MTRLLHAAARGARIQWSTDLGMWKTTPNILPKVYGPDKWRIHPEDEHLQYGPISSALREEAKAPGRYYYRAISNELRYGFDFGLAEGGIFLYDLEADEMTRSLFLLILSEALADEGM